MPYECPIIGDTRELRVKTDMGHKATALDPTKLDGFSGENADQPSKKGEKVFFIYNDEDERSTQSDGKHVEDQKSGKMPLGRNFPIRVDGPVTRSKSQKKYMNAGGISKLSFNLDEILKFPKESTHAYSYAHLSPNSLAVRLSILKRSLEILIDRPDLMSEEQRDSQSEFNNATALDIDIEGFISKIQAENENGGIDEPSLSSAVSSPTTQHSKINISSNASSAALSALFNNRSHSSPANAPKPASPCLRPQSHESLKRQGLSEPSSLKTLISFLREDELHNTKEKKKLAENLHNLSLSSFEEQGADSESQLRIKLLHALATPFYESIVQTPIIMMDRGASSLALSSLNNKVLNSPTLSALDSPSSSLPTNGSSKPNNLFHPVSQKNTSPQAVFTCELSDPWSLKAANDLACLIFGVSRNSLRRLTLLDLISPDSRDFVLNRLIATSLIKNDMIFSGEIIAIARPGNKLTWASLWAKKKGNLIICMFDQVPCDSIDLVVNLENLNIESHKKISGGSFFSDNKTEDNVNQILPHFHDTIEKSRAKNHDGNIPQTILDSQAVNEQRYFTIKRSDFNIPCAVTSKIKNENESKLKLKIHSLPYIAGVFIISATDYKCLSFNQSISKNLFGFNESQLLNQSITKVVPSFIKIMEFVKRNIQHLKIIPGLVLPEHFFRQIDVLINNGRDDDFLNSVGLDGLHADGSKLKIDVQLRCSTVDTLVLWITHSRSVYGDKINSRKQRVTFDNNNEYHENRSSHSTGDDSGDERELPSQLSILNESEIQSVSGSSSMRSTVNNNSSSTSVSNSSGSTSQSSSTTDLKKLHINESVKNIAKHDHVNLDIYKMLDSTMDEAMLLKIENETIQRQKSTSSYYPKTIGLKRREKSFKEFRILKKMGQGAYGKVYLTENKKDPSYRIVIKLIIKERILVDTWVRDRKLGTIPSEIQIMATLNNNPHPNIMRLIDFFEDDDYYYIETPQHGFPAPAIDLFDMIELKKSMTEEECKSIMKQCNSALNHLHNNGVVHRDIKDENLIIDAKGVIKLIDFGSAAYTKQGPFDVFVGTLDYAAPEVLNGLPYEGKPQDVWSLGVLMYTLVYKENPFYNVDEIMEGELRVPFVTSEGCINLIKKILNRDISKRPTMAEIVEDPWFSEK